MAGSIQLRLHSLGGLLVRWICAISSFAVCLGRVHGLVRSDESRHQAYRRAPPWRSRCWTALGAVCRLHRSFASKKAMIRSGYGNHIMRSVELLEQQGELVTSQASDRVMWPATGD